MRFLQLNERGLTGSDTVYYTSLALRWADGDLDTSIGSGPRVSRPVVLAAFAGAMVLFGPDDDSIKRLNGLLEVGNVGLVALLASWIWRRRAVTLATAVLYSWAPLAIWASRQELTHTLSTFFVLSAVVLVVAAQRTNGRNRRRVALLASGSALALAVMTHEELILIGPILALFACTSARGRSAKELAVFLLGLIVVSAPMLWLATPTVTGYLERAAARPQPQALEMVGRSLRWSWNAVAGVTSVAFAWLVVACSGAALIAALRRPSELVAALARIRDRLWLIPASVALGYSVGYALLFPVLFVRLFLPFLPLVLVAAVGCGERALRRRVPASSGGRFWLAVVVFLIVQVDQLRFHRDISGRRMSDSLLGPALPAPRLPEAIADFERHMLRPTWERHLFDQLGSRVDSTSRLWVSSSLMYPHAGRRALQMPFYFGDDAIYAIDQQRPLVELIGPLRLRLFLFSSFLGDRRLLERSSLSPYLGGGQWGAERELELGKPYGLAAGTYSQAREYEALSRLMTEIGAEVEMVTGTFAAGTPPTFDPDDGSLIVWRLPGQVDRPITRHGGDGSSPAAWPPP
ncbi:MAG: glycosyltransferase family 39 protein [Holophagales bacterium]|nr:glycosyltransferase family 39 protein [Holophagales bacterium]